MADGNTKIDAPGYGEVIVLAGALMWALNLSPPGGGGGTGPFDIAVTVTDSSTNTPVNGATVTGDTGLGSISGTTNASGQVTFSGIPAGSTGNLTAVAAGFSSHTVLINPLTANISITIPLLPANASIVLSGGSGDGTGVTFTVTVSGLSGTIPAVLVAIAHDSSGAPLVSATSTGTLQNGTINPTINWSTPITAAGTYACTATANSPNGTQISNNVLQFNITVSGGGGGVQAVLSGGRSLTGADIEFSSVLSGAPAAVPITYHAAIKNAVGATLQLDTVTHSQANGTYAVHVPTSPNLTAGTYGVTAFATDSTGASISNTLNFNVTIGGGGGGTFTITVHSTNATTGANLGGTRCTFGAATVTTTLPTGTAIFRNVPAGTSGLITATHTNYDNATFTVTNLQANLTAPIPMNPVSALRVVLANGSATGVNVTFHLAVTGAPAGGVPVSINAFAHDSIGNQVAFATATRTITNSSSGIQTFSWATSITTAGSYTASVEVSDSSGVRISNVLVIPFTVSGGGGPVVSLSAGSATGTTFFFAELTQNAPATVHFTAVARNNVGQTVATITADQTWQVGPANMSFSWPVSITAPGMYSFTAFATVTGGNNTNTLTGTFTVGTATAQVNIIVQYIVGGVPVPINVLGINLSGRIQSSSHPSTGVYVFTSVPLGSYTIDISLPPGFSTYSPANVTVSGSTSVIVTLH